MYRETLESELPPAHAASQAYARDAVQPEPADGLDLLDALLIFARRKWLIVFFTLAGGLAVLIWAERQPRLYRSDAVILSPQDQQSGSSLLGQLSALSGIGGGAKGASEMYVGLLKSRTVREGLARQFDLAKTYGTGGDVAIAADVLGSRTKIMEQGSGLIDITVADRDPKLAMELANAYANALYGLNKTLAIGQASQRRLFFDQQLAQEKERLTNAEIALKQVEEQTGVIQLQGQTSVTLSRISQLQADITSRQIQLAELHDSATDQNPEVVRIQSELTALQGQLTAMLGKSGSDLPDSLGIPRSRVPELSLEYIRKERDVQYHQTLYDLLARQLEAARIDEAKAAPIVQILDPAELPRVPYFPRVAMFTGLGALVGFILGCIRCVVIYIYDYIDDDPRLRGKMWAVKAAIAGRTS